MNKFKLFLLIFCLFLVRLECNIAKADYFVSDDEKVALRFNKLDLPIEEGSVKLKIFADTEEVIFINCVNPDTGYRANFKLEFSSYLDFIIPKECFSEDGTILIFIYPNIGIAEQDVVISGLESLSDQVFSGTSGIVFPAAATLKQTLLNWEPFFMDNDRFSLESKVFQMFKNEKKRTFSEGYLLLDFKYKFLVESKRRPTISCGVISGEGTTNRSKLKDKAVNGIYVVGSKNISKIFNSSLGILHGDILSIFAFDKEDYKKSNLDSSSILFTSFFVRLAENSGLKFETGLDFKNSSEVYLFAFSHSLFANAFSIDVGTSVTEVNSFWNSRLFVSIRFKV
ncbi:MAG: hypothetical protein GY817_05310 [bacterium]|nr:hypothetical protein [bacterium]